MSFRITNQRELDRLLTAVFKRAEKNRGEATLLKSERITLKPENGSTDAVTFGPGAVVFFFGNRPLVGGGKGVKRSPDYCFIKQGNVQVTVKSGKLELKQLDRNLAAPRQSPTSRVVYGGRSRTA